MLMIPLSIFLSMDSLPPIQAFTQLFYYVLTSVLMDDGTVAESPPNVCWLSLVWVLGAHFWNYIPSISPGLQIILYFIVLKYLEPTCLFEILSQVLSSQHIYNYWFLWERPDYICAYLRTTALKEALKVLHPIWCPGPRCISLLWCR